MLIVCLGMWWAIINAVRAKCVGQVESSGGDGAGSEDAAASMIQRFWDSAMAMGPLDDETDTQSQMRLLICKEL